jgi:hypothetical protein
MNGCSPRRNASGTRPSPRPEEKSHEKDPETFPVLHCDGGDFSGTTCASLGFHFGTLSCSSCMLDASGCVGKAFPASGQSFSMGRYTDGADQAGAPLNFVDNGDGTISDLNTGLMWEKKDDSGGLHDKDNGMSWCVDQQPPLGTCDNPALDGTIIQFMDTLNDAAGGGANCFAGYCDWRVPNIRELVSIVDYDYDAPAIEEHFHNPAGCPGCTDITLADCSCTATTGTSHWSSTIHSRNSDEAWIVDFLDGEARPLNLTAGVFVRAVRSGP